MSPLCLDSSILIKLLTGEPGSEAAAAVVTPDSELVAPAFAWAEVGSALRKKVRTGELDPVRAGRAWDDFLKLDLRFLQRPDLMRRSWDLAGRFSLPTLYDAAFLAAAEQAPGGPCLMWTADPSFLRAVAGRHPLVAKLGQPAEQVGSAVRLVAFDLDGTLVRGDTVCEILARPLGRLERMRTFEALTDRPAIAAARREMAAWYRQADPAVLQAALDGLALAPGAEAAFAWLRRQGVRTAIVSITWEFAVEAVARRLGADEWVGTRLQPGGEVMDFWPEDKRDWLAGLLEGYGLGPGQTAAVGDSAGDVPMLRWAGRRVCVGRNLPPELDDVVHLPDADLMEVVAAIGA
jgi:HAD superfamily phosphoserine phosphatase-like hydrolase